MDATNLYEQKEEEPEYIPECDRKDLCPRCGYDATLCSCTVLPTISHFKLPVQGLNIKEGSC